MIMGVRCAYGALLKFNLNEHYLTVIPQNLTNNAFTGGLLLLVFFIVWKIFYFGKYTILNNKFENHEK